ncbi:hypothetical protein ACUY4Q_003664 [Phytobacter sp. AG2a]
MAMSACRVLQANDYGAMNQQLTSSMSQGWKPFGRLIVTDSPRDFYQVMYQGNDIDLETYQSIVSDGGTTAVRNSAGTITDTGTFSVSQNVITAVTLPATSTIVKNSDANITVLPASGSTPLLSAQTADVSVGALNGVRLAAANSVVKNNDAVTVANSANSVTASGTATVSTNAVQRVSLPATNAIVSNSQVLSIPVTAGILVAIGTATRTVTLTVSAGVPTAISIS